MKHYNYDSKALIKNMPTAFSYHKVIFDENNKPVDYVFLDVNKKFEEYTGLKKEEVINKKATEVLDNITESSFDWIKFYGELSLNEDSDSFIEYSKPLNRWYKLQVYSQKKGYFTTLFNDVTKKKEKENKLQNMSEQLNDIFDNINDIVWSISWPDLKVQFISKAVEDIVGYKREDFKEDPMLIQKITHPEDKETNEKAIKQLEENGDTEREFRVICKDGTVKWIQDRGKMVYNEKNEPVKVEGVMRDITKIKKQRKELEMMEFTLDKSRMLIFRTKPEGIIDYVNEKVLRKLNYKREELVDKHVKEILKKYNYVEREKFWNDVKESKSMTYEREFITKNGNKFPAEMTSQYFKYGDKEYEFAFAKDITERKDANEKIKNNKEKYETIFNSSSVGIILIDKDGNIIEANKMMSKMTGYTEDELENSNVFDVFVLPEDKERAKKYINKVIEENQEVKFETNTKTKNGETKKFQLNETSIRLPNGEKGLVSMQLDITGQKRNEKIMKELNKVAVEFQTLDNKKEICQKTIEIARKVLDFDLCSIRLVENNKLIPIATHYRRDPDILPIDYGIMGKAYKNNKNYLTSNIDKDPNANPIKSSYKSAITVSMKNSGVFQAISNKKNNFNQKDLELAEILIYNTKTALDRVNYQKKLKYKSFHDNLTNLYNRRFFEEEMTRLDTKRQLPLSIIMADVNGLKMINDTYGHKKGDKLLVKTSKILKNSIRKEDLLARWAGDEFVILLPQTPRKKAQKIMKRIKNKDKKLRESNIPISIGMGVATKSKVKQNIDKLIEKADDNMYRNKLSESRSASNKIVQNLINTLGAKSSETKEHAMRMTNLAYELGKKLNLSNSEMNKLSLLATLHDIGKTTISEDILTKPGRLTEKEWEIIKEHPERGYKIASASEEFILVAEEILSHHEHWDGNGYPRGLERKDISYLARIISIIDAYDVMTNYRPYSKAMSIKEALSEIKNCAGSQFDPELAKEFIELKTTS